MRHTVLKMATLAGLLEAGAARAEPIGAVFVIAMENHNFRQPDGPAKHAAILGNPAAPFQNRLVTPGNPAAAQTAFAGNYQNVGAGVHPSEPNYIWAEAGADLGVRTDRDPFGPGGTNQDTEQTLCGLLQRAGIDWRSYQEDIDHATDDGRLTDAVLPRKQWTVPLASFGGASPGYTNRFNGGHDYKYSAKHNPMVFFTVTNGGEDASPANTLAGHYAPLDQLEADLAAGTVARYNWITPDPYNDSHSALPDGFVHQGTRYEGDAAEIAQGDSFLARIVPTIMASAAYRANGVIVIWWDETEGGDDPARTLEEIVISPLAKGNAYSNTVRYTHSSDLLTWQKVFGVGPCLRDACAATDLSDLFRPGTIPATIAGE